MAQGRRYNKSYADRIMREAFVKEVGAYLDFLICESYISPTQILEDFGVAYDTTKSFRLGLPSISFDTARLFCYIFAYYMESIFKLVDESCDFKGGHDVKVKFKNELMEKYRSFYGIQADFALEMVHKKIDLRQVVKHE